jgi:sulfite reductase (ferredoxin)
VPSKKIPETVDALTDAYAHGRESGERFQAWIARIGKRSVKELIKPFMAVPPHAEDPSFYSDWSDVREFTIGDLGVGECAGEVVSLFGIEVVKAEAQAFDAQIALDEGDPEGAEELAYAAMLSAARALVRTEYIDVTQKPDDIVAEWKKRFFDTERFFDRFAKGAFGRYLLDRHASPPERVTAELAAQRVEEAQLFIEAAQACEAREVAARVVPSIPGAASDDADLAPAEA